MLACDNALQANFIFPLFVVYLSYFTKEKLIHAIKNP